MHWKCWVVCSLILVVNMARSNRAQNVMAMRGIDLIVIHCTATRENQRLSEEELEVYHRSLGYEGCGYHFYVRRDGNVIAMRPLHKAGAHVKGHNSRSIEIAYEGGLDFLENPKDTRTENQRNSLQLLVSSLKQDFPFARVLGHRDLSPDLDGNGQIDPREWLKECPCFDVRTEL